MGFWDPSRRRAPVGIIPTEHADHDAYPGMQNPMPPGGMKFQGLPAADWPPAKKLGWGLGDRVRWTCPDGTVQSAEGVATGAILLTNGDWLVTVEMDGGDCFDALVEHLRRVTNS